MTITASIAEAPDPDAWSPHDLHRLRYPSSDPENGWLERSAAQRELEAAMGELSAEAWEVLVDIARDIGNRRAWAGMEQMVPALINAVVTAVPDLDGIDHNDEDELKGFFEDVVTEEAEAVATTHFGCH